jgi:hypothetical protein
MNDTMLLNILRLPPTVWRGKDELDILGRYRHYLDAADRIESDHRRIGAARELLGKMNCDDLAQSTGTSREHCQALLSVVMDYR